MEKEFGNLGRKTPVQCLWHESRVIFTGKCLYHDLIGLPNFTLSHCRLFQLKNASPHAHLPIQQDVY